MGHFLRKIPNNGYPFLQKWPLKMGTGLEASASHPRPNNIWVPPPPPPGRLSRSLDKFIHSNFKTTLFSACKRFVRAYVGRGRKINKIWSDMAPASTGPSCCCLQAPYVPTVFDFEQFFTRVFRKIRCLTDCERQYVNIRILITRIAVTGTFRHCKLLNAGVVYYKPNRYTSRCISVNVEHITNKIY